jgi:hypothetical protein
MYPARATKSLNTHTANNPAVGIFSYQEVQEQGCIHIGNRQLVLCEQCFDGIEVTSSGGTYLHGKGIDDWHG